MDDERDRAQHLRQGRWASVAYIGSSFSLEYSLGVLLGVLPDVCREAVPGVYVRQLSYSSGAKQIEWPTPKVRPASPTSWLDQTRLDQMAGRSEGDKQSARTCPRSNRQGPTSSGLTSKSGAMQIEVPDFFLCERRDREHRSEARNRRRQTALCDSIEARTARFRTHPAISPTLIAHAA